MQTETPSGIIFIGDENPKTGKSGKASATGQTKPNPNQNAVYKVKFKGQYYVEGPLKGQKKNYVFDDILMSEHEREMGFLHVFVRQILSDDNFINNKARVKYPDWKKHRTYEEDGVQLKQPDGSFKPIQEFGLMNRAQLVAFINLKKLDINADLYPTAAELKQAITDYRDDRKAFMAYQDKRKVHEGAKLAAAKNVRDLNDWSTPDRPTDAEDKLASEYCIPKDLEEQDEIKDFLDML